jgi:peptide-methionine (S)-S-oxide reductase
MAEPIARRRSVLLGLVGAGLAAGGIGLVATRSSAGEGRAIPAPADEGAAAPGATAEVAVLAAGCFWGVQGVFQHVEGVTSAVSGYAGGDARQAHYELVSSGATGHAEAVKVAFDPRRISYARILQVFFSVAHDPTQLNRQGPDVGPQYRSAIFPTSTEQARIARAYIAQLDQAHVFPRPIVTRIEPDRPFYPAEDYHQDYMTRHPTQPYIAINDLPKVEDLRRFFPERYREAPVLVAATGIGN